MYTKLSHIPMSDCFNFLNEKNQFDFLFSYGLFELVDENCGPAAVLFSDLIFSFEGRDNFKKSELRSLLEICNHTIFERVKYCPGKWILKEYVQKNIS